MRSRSAFALVVIGLFAISSLSLSAQTALRKSLQITLAAERNGKPTATFAADVVTIYAYWQGNSFEIGDTVKAVWIAEDVVGSESKHTKIRDGSAKVFKHEEVGEFSLSRPAGQVWPTGKYAVEFYVNDKLTEIAKFTIQPPVKIEVH